MNNFNDLIHLKRLYAVMAKQILFSPISFRKTKYGNSFIGHAEMWMACCDCKLQRRNARIEFKNYPSDLKRIYITAHCDKGHLAAESWCRHTDNIYIWPDRVDGPAEIYYDYSGHAVFENWSYNRIELPQFKKILGLGEPEFLDYVKFRNKEFRHAAIAVYMTLRPDHKISQVLLAAEALL